MINKKLKIATLLFLAFAHQYLNSMEQPAIETFSGLIFEVDLTALTTFEEDCDKLHYRLILDVINNNYRHANKILQRMQKSLNSLPFINWIDQSNEQLRHSALTLAAQNDSKDIVRLLISFGASPYSLNDNGMSAIDIAKIKEIGEETREQGLLAILQTTTRYKPKPIYPKSIIRILCEEQEASFDGLPRKSKLSNSH